MQQRLSYIDAGIDSWEQLLKMITKDAVEKVESINLHSNKLSKIEPAIKSFKALKRLDLSSNDIVDLSGIVGVGSISHLNLSANKIRTLSTIGQLVNLQYLNLSCNRIESISAISNLKHLRFLDLHANQIRTNAEIIHLKKLTKLKELVLNDDNRDSGMNPICKQAGYEKEVWKILPQLLILNGLDKLGNITPTMYKHPDLEMYAALLSCEKKQVMPIENQKDLDEALTFDVDIRIKELEKSLAAHAEQGCPNSDYGSRVQKVESQIAQLLNGSEYHRIQNQGYDALVTALEAERKKSKEKELQYSQKIKILTNQHQDVKKENAFLIEKLRIQEATLFKANLKLEDYENMKLSSKELRKQLSEMSKQKASMDEKYRKTQNQYPEIKSANDLLVKELETSSLNLKRLGNEFNELRKNHDTSTIKIQELNDLLRRCEVEKTRVTESTALEITEWKGKCAEAIKEKGIIFDALTHSNDEISSLKTSLETKESQYLNEIKQLKAYHLKEIESEVARAAAVAQEKFNVQIQALVKSQSMSSESFQILSREYTHTIKSDAKKSEILEKKLEKSQMELDSVKAQVESFRLKNKEDSATIAKLNKYVQELRNSIEKSKRIQKDSVAEKDSRHRQILTENQLLSSQLKHAQFANADMMGEIEKFSERKLPESDIDHLRDAIKVKDSMLEDQADSIRKLKTNLENKCREFSNTVTELNKLRESTADATETYEKMLSTLKEDLDAIEANEIHYRKLALDYKAERDDLKVKLEERHASVSKIEEEVLRIKYHFEMKEKELASSHAADLNELQLKHNNYTQRILGERQLLSQKLQSLQDTLAIESKKRITIEDELKTVMTELAKERQRSNQRLVKLRKLIEV